MLLQYIDKDAEKRKKEEIKDRAFHALLFAGICYAKEDNKSLLYDLVEKKALKVGIVTKGVDLVDMKFYKLNGE